MIILLLLQVGCKSMPASVYPPINLNQTVNIKKPTIALVLGGGGARGFAHLGVLKALEEAKIPLDLIVGCSMGSLVGSLYAANPNIDHLTNVLMQASYSDYLDFSLGQAMTGPVLGHKLQNFIAKYTQDCLIQQLKIPFIAVATDFKTGQTVTLASGCLSLAVVASCAIPSLVTPIQFANATLVDGGLVDPVPVDIAKQYHPKLTIAVDVSSDPDENLSFTLPNIIHQSITLMTRSLTDYNLLAADIVIRPKVGCASTFNLSEKEKFYQAGLIAGREAIPRIKKYLNSQQSSINGKCINH